MNRTTALRLVALALVVGAATDILFRGNAPGINVVLDVALLLVAAALAAGRARLRRVDPFDWWLAPGALAFAVGIAVRADPVLILVDLAGAGALSAGALATLGGARVTRAAVGAVAWLPLDFAGAAIAGAVPALRAARPAPGATGRARHAPGGLAPILRGVALVVPLVIVFAALFAAADAVFADVAGRVLALPFGLPLADLAEHTAWIATVGWVVAGMLALAAGAPGLVAHLGWSSPPATDFAVSRDAEPAAVDTVGFAATSDASGRIEALVVLLGLDLLFAAFVALQVAYLFGGHDTMAAAGLSYAEYARRGFFELLAAAGLAALVVAGLETIVPDRGRMRRAAAVGLLGLTGVVLVSSFLRLRLYQEAYGWTELRFWVLLSIGWLGASLLAMVGLLLARRSDRMVHAVVIAGIGAVLVANLAAPERLVAEQNLARTLQPSLVPAGGSLALDDGYLGYLGDDAIPTIVAALPRLPAAEQSYLRTVLDERYAELATDPNLLGWPAWNLSRERARAALATLPR